MDNSVHAFSCALEEMYQVPVNQHDMPYPGIARVAVMPVAHRKG